MRLKIIICLLVLQILHATDAFSLANDSINRLSISDHLVLNEATGQPEIHTPDHLFFDVDIHKVYFNISVTRTNLADTTQYLLLEIKKKSSQQFRLRPIQSKKIQLNATTVYLDSLVFDDSLLASGNFDFIVRYMNDSMKAIDTRNIPFQLLRATNQAMKDDFYALESDNTTNHVSIEKTFVQKYEIAQLKKNILSLSPLAQISEERVIRELAQSDDQKTLRLFFYNFWFNRNPSAPEKAWNDYTIILNALAKKYGTASSPGYETDRGRIYIRYGEPDRIVRATNEKKALPYEVWFYYRSGTKTNLKFLFFQPGMLGSLMMLLHSNVPEETVNPYWKEMLLSDPGNRDNKLTHKVFEFFN
jgi:GWxTD domain-containing protein